MGTLEDLIKEEKKEKKGKIMVIDKLPETSEALQNLLPDYEFISYPEVNKAVEELARNPSLYDLIFLDIDVRTSIYEGEEAYNKLRAHNKDIPIIFHTGMDKSFKMSYEYLKKVSGYCIQKGEDPEGLINIVNNVIKEYRSKK